MEDGSTSFMKVDVRGEPHCRTERFHRKARRACERASERAGERAVDMSAYYGQAAFIRQKRAFKGGDKIVNSISWKKPRSRYPFTIFPHFFTVGFRELTLYFRAGVANRVAVHLLPDDNEPATGEGKRERKRKDYGTFSIRIAFLNRTLCSVVNDDRGRAVAQALQRLQRQK